MRSLSKILILSLFVNLNNVILFHWNTAVFVAAKLNDNNLILDVNYNAKKTTCRQNAVSNF